MGDADFEAEMKRRVQEKIAEMRRKKVRDSSHTKNNSHQRKKKTKNWKSNFGNKSLINIRALLTGCQRQ